MPETELPGAPARAGLPRLSAAREAPGAAARSAAALSTCTPPASGNTPSPMRQQHGPYGTAQDRQAAGAPESIWHESGTPPDRHVLGDHATANDQGSDLGNKVSAPSRT